MSHPSILEAKYPEKMSYDQLREAVKASWEEIPKERLDKVIESVASRCKAVIKANGMYTKF